MKIKKMRSPSALCIIFDFSFVKGARNVLFRIGYNAIRIHENNFDFGKIVAKPSFFILYADFSHYNKFICVSILDHRKKISW